MGRPRKLENGVALYSAMIFATLVGFSLYQNGLYFWRDWDGPEIMVAVFFVPFFAALIWLRWDWAPAEAARRKAEKEAGATSVDR
jgi:hypothetical protein